MTISVRMVRVEAIRKIIIILIFDNYVIKNAASFIDTKKKCVESFTRPDYLYGF